MDVIISIRPEWCKKIISGEKTLEVRKTFPDFAIYPFRVFVYATFGGENWFYYGKQMSKHVIGEFSCDNIDILYVSGKQPELLQKTCLSEQQLQKYAGDSHYVYGWEISDFQMYQDPLPIGYFANFKGEPLRRPPQSWQYAFKM